MDIKIVDTEGKEIAQDQTVPTSAQNITEDGAPFLETAISELFNFSRSEERMFKSKINTLIDYAKTQTEDHSPESIKWVLRSLQLKLGTPRLGERMIDPMTRFAHLSMEKAKIDKELNKFI